jgi:N-methylhydantoinase B
MFAPQGTLLNPLSPAAVGNRTYTIKRTVDVLLGALAKAIPERIPAASHGQNTLMLIGGRRPTDGSPFVGFIGVPMCGGMGARCDRDGIDVIETDINNCTNFPIEACEMEFPIRFEYCRLWPDSGGAGRYRGGLGYMAACQWLGDRVTLSHRRDRHNFQPWGLMGGRPAPNCRSAILRKDGGVEELPSKKLTYLDPGEVLQLYTTGGGGYGDPLTRDPGRVLDDVQDGRVSAEAAAQVYGVVMDSARRNVDQPATEDLRADLRNGRKAL